jgi:hypothetical protein
MVSTKMDSDSLHTQTFLSMFPTTYESTAGDTTYVSADFVHGLVDRDTNGAARTDTVPSAASIVAHMKAINSAATNDSSCWVFVRNSGADSLTIAANTGVTLQGASTVAAGKTALFLLRVEDATNDAVELYRIE